MRYLPHTETDRADMLAAIGVASVDELFSDVPPGKLLKGHVDLPRRKTELDVSRTLRKLAAKNHAAGDGPFFVGAGAYRHHVPASVDHIIQRSEFLTSYTPYQPEISQGTLQYLFEFQTQVANLTAMEVANASMYDGSTATAEAVLMAHRMTRRRKAVISGGLHPHYRETVETVSRMAGDELVGARPRPARHGGHPRRDRRGDLLRRRAVALLLRPAHRPEADRRQGAGAMARCSSPSSPRWSRSACSSRRARRAPTSSWARARASATR